jgi:hypothetical protein
MPHVQLGRYRCYHLAAAEKWLGGVLAAGSDDHIQREHAVSGERVYAAGLCCGASSLPDWGASDGLPARPLAMVRTEECAP